MRLCTVRRPGGRGGSQRRAAAGAHDRALECGVVECVAAHFHLAGVDKVR